MAHTTAPLDTRVGYELLEQLGFLHVPAATAGSGPAYLLVAIRRRPTLDHYDPELIRYWVACDGRGTCDEMTISSRMPLQAPFSWGTIRLVDRLGVSNEYLTFGGDLSAERVAGAVVSVFRSPAPLLTCGGHSQGWDAGAHAVAGFFGRLRAEVGADRQLERVVADTPPLALFAAFVAEAARRLRGSEELRAIEPILWRWIRREARGLASERPPEWAAGQALNERRRWRPRPVAPRG